MTETLEQEYRRLVAERESILREAARTTGVWPDERIPGPYQTVMTRLRVVAAIPPDGYTLPKQAADLCAHAKANGWQAWVVWPLPGWERETFVDVAIGRLVEDGDDVWQFSEASNLWKYRLTWRESTPGAFRLSGRCLAQTPEKPAEHHGPSVKGIRDVITRHPAPTAVAS